MQGVTIMLKDELNAKRERYRKLKEEEEQYLVSDAVKQQINKDAQRIWTRVKEIFRKMPLSKDYHLFVGYENNKIAWNNPDLNTVYWTDLQEYGPFYELCIHQMFFFHSKLEYPEETMKALRKLAESEGLECRPKNVDANRFLTYHILDGLEFIG